MTIDPRTVQVLLDPSQAARLLASLPGEDPRRGVEIESVWAKPGRHFNVCYRVDDADGGHLASLCAVNESEAARAARRLGRAGGALALPREDVLAQRFPYDYRLEHLAACVRPEAVREAIRDDAIDGCDVAAYRAGMRCQIRYTARGTARAYGKIAFDREPGRRRRVHRETRDATNGGELRLPPPAGAVDALGLDLVAAVDGRSLHDALAESADPRVVESTARALAELHRTAPAPADRVHAAADELALVRSWVEWMSYLEPSLAAPLARALERLAASLPESAPTSFAHRDFHDKQVLLGASHLWLLDTDTACTGDPELDLGNFLAHLFLRGVQWKRAAGHQALEAAAIAGYGAGGRPRATGWYRRATLTRLACVYQLRPRWRSVVPELLEEALVP